MARGGARLPPSLAATYRSSTVRTSYYFFGGPDMTQDQVKAKEDAVDKLTTKAEIVQALKDSFTNAHSFVDGITPENAFVAMPNGSTRAGLASFGLAHMMDHYGQLVVYLRMKNLVPPASEPRPQNKK